MLEQRGSVGVYNRVAASRELRSDSSPGEDTFEAPAAEATAPVQPGERSPTPSSPARSWQPTDEADFCELVAESIRVLQEDLKNVDGAWA